MGLLDGRKALVAGVTNKKSIAWGIAQALYAQGKSDTQYNKSLRLCSLCGLCVRNK